MSLIGVIKKKIILYVIVHIDHLILTIDFRFADSLEISFSLIFHEGVP